jgi:signal peptidase I
MTAERRRRWAPFILTLALGIPLVLFVRQNIAVFGMAQGDSMSPAVPDDSFRVVEKLSDQVSELERGDVVAVLQPSEVDFEAPPLMEGPYLVKRVIGLPGEVIEIRDSTVYVNGVALDEPYLRDGLEYGDVPPLTVPDQAIYVLGDNRPDSTDSRAFGPVAEANLVGRIIVNVPPPD